MFSSDFGFEIINVDDLSLQEERFLPSELLAYARDENESSFVRDIEGHLTLVYSFWIRKVTLMMFVMCRE